MAKIKNLSILIATMVWKPWSPPSGGETRYYEKRVSNQQIFDAVCQANQIGDPPYTTQKWIYDQIKCVRGNPDLFGPLSGKHYD